MRFKTGLGRILLSYVVLAPALAPQVPQKPDKDQDLPPSIQVDVDVVNILASVRDKKGALIPNLSKDDFIVNEDGKAQSIKYFAREADLPLTIGLLVDVSGSQANLIETERRAAYQFFSQVLRKKDEAFLISFGGESELLQDFTNSAKLLDAGLEKLRVNSGISGVHPGPVPTIGQPRGTVLYDAVYLAATDRLRTEVGRKAIVVITDGVDQGSRLSLNQAIEAAQKADAVVYSIYYVDPGAYYGHGIFGGMSDSALKKMSEETGGRVMKVDRKHTLEEIFQQLQEELRTQYAIGYTPSNAERNGGFRKVDVQVRNKDLKVQARKGYYASKPEIH
jgi:VWFA-related protein